MKFKYYLRGAGIGVIVSTVVLAVAFLFQKNTMSDAEIIQRALELGMVMEENSDNKTLADISEKNATKADMETEADQEAGGENGATTADDSTGKASSGGSVASGKDGSDQNGSDQNESDGASGSDSSGGQETGEDSVSGSDDSDTSSSDKKNSDKNNSDKNDSAKNDSDKNDSDKKSDENNSEKDTPDKDGSGQGDSSGKNGDDAEEKTVTVTINSGDVSRVVSDRVFEAGLVESADDFNNYLGANGYDKMLRAGTYEIKAGSSYKQIAKILTTRQ